MSEQVNYGSFVFELTRLDNEQTSPCQVNSHKLEINDANFSEYGITQTKGDFPVAYFGYLTTNGRKGHTAWCWEIETRKGRKALPLLSTPYRGKDSKKIDAIALKTAGSAAQMIIENSPLKGRKTMKKASVGVRRCASSFNPALINKIARVLMKKADIIRKFEGTEEEAQKQKDKLRQECEIIKAEIKAFKDDKIAKALKKYKLAIDKAMKITSDFQKRVSEIDEEAKRHREKLLEELKGDLTKEYGVEDVEGLSKAMNPSNPAANSKIAGLNMTTGQWILKAVQLRAALEAAGIKCDDLNDILTLCEARISKNPSYDPFSAFLSSCLRPIMREKYNTELADKLFSKTLMTFQVCFEEGEREYSEISEENQRTIEETTKNFKSSFMFDAEYKDARDELEGQISPVKKKKSSMNVHAARMVRAGFLTDVKRSFRNFWNWTKDRVAKICDKIISVFDKSEKQLDKCIADVDRLNSALDKAIEACRKELLKKQ